MAKLLPSDGAAGDRFGGSVSISGDTIVIGADGDDDSGLDSGSVYVFVQPSTGWAGTLNEDAKLLASEGAAGDHFGTSVGISGDAVAAGAPCDDDDGTDSGSAYVFAKPGAGWTGTLNEQVKLHADDGAAGSGFGASIAISGDTVAVGAPLDDDAGADSGSAYVFEKPGAGWFGTITENAKLLAHDGAAGDQFGTSVSISNDTVSIGAQLDDDNGIDSGSAYIFERPGAGWAGTVYDAAKLLASDGAPGDQFGTSASISGDTVGIGARFDDDDGADSGSAYIFEKPPGGWAGTLGESAKLPVRDAAVGDNLGASVSVSGETIIVGAPLRGADSGSAHIFMQPPVGDVNCDAVVNSFDIDTFILALISAHHAAPFDEYYALWPDCNPMLADINGDGNVDNFDIDPLVELLD